MASKYDKERYQYVFSLLEEERRQLSSLQHSESEVKLSVKFLTEWLEDLQTGICKSCGGYGYYRVIVAQDESRRESCSKCKGTGLVEE